MIYLLRKHEANGCYVRLRLEGFYAKLASRRNRTDTFSSFFFCVYQCVAGRFQAGFPPLCGTRSVTLYGNKYTDTFSVGRGQLQRSTILATGVFIWRVLLGRSYRKRRSNDRSVSTLAVLLEVRYLSRVLVPPYWCRSVTGENATHSQ